MRKWFVSRHEGAVRWARSRLPEAQVFSALSFEDIDRLTSGDEVYGTLPVDLASRVCARGARLFFLVFDRQDAVRGDELSEEELVRRCARFEAFFVTREEPC